MKINILIHGLTLTFLALLGCTKTDYSSASTAATADTYAWVSGSCYDQTTKTYVASSYCSSSSSSNSTYFYMNGSTCMSRTTGAAVSSTYCTSNPFSWNGSNCYDSVAQTYVSSTYCSSTSTSSSGYYYSGGYCYSSAGQVVSSSYCGSTSTANKCYGYFYSNYYGWIYCNGANCAGLPLYSYPNMQLTMCQ